MLSPWPTIVLSTIYLSVLMHCCTTGWIPKLISVFRCSWPTPNVNIRSLIQMKHLMLSDCSIFRSVDGTLGDCVDMGKFACHGSASSTVNAFLMIWNENVCRTVFLDGWNRQIFVSHSIFLCFMFGPLGVLSHHLTEKLTQNRSNHQNEEDSESVAMTEKISPFLKR